MIILRSPFLSTHFRRRPAAEGIFAAKKLLHRSWDVQTRSNGFHPWLLLKLSGPVCFKVPGGRGWDDIMKCWIISEVSGRFLTKKHMSYGRLYTYFQAFLLHAILRHKTWWQPRCHQKTVAGNIGRMWETTPEWLEAFPIKISVGKVRTLRFTFYYDPCGRVII